MQAKKYLIVIAGPTAVGKTNVSIQIAAHFNTAVLSADSRQCFKEIPIGTAQPSLEEQMGIPHYFIRTHSVHDELNAGAYEQYALATLTHLFEKHDCVVVCGGTGLYIDALCNGIDEMPDVSKDIEVAIQTEFQEKGLSWLQETCATEDPIFWQQAEQQNPVRLIRALSFIRSTGLSIMAFRNKTKKERSFHIIKIALELPRAQLYERINTRVVQMIQQGLLNEVAIQYPNRQLKSLATVGYTEFYQYNHWPLAETELESAIDKVKQHSRNYAKRQLTWFRKDTDYTWFTPNDINQIIRHIEEQMKKS